MDPPKNLDVRTFGNHVLSKFVEFKWLLANFCVLDYGENGIRGSSKDLESVRFIDSKFSFKYQASFVDVHHIMSSSEQWFATFVKFIPGYIFALSPSFFLHQTCDFKCFCISNPYKYEAIIYDIIEVDASHPDLIVHCWIG